MNEAQRKRWGEAMAPIPPAPNNGAVYGQSPDLIPQYTDAIPPPLLGTSPRLKTNEEWVAEASAAADAAANVVLRRTTAQRLKALSDNIIGDYERGVETRSELVEEFANLVS